VTSLDFVFARTSLATETDYVRGRLAEYTNDLLSLGVDGLRLDAAKRAEDLAL
jgi:glycosidase